MTVLPTLIAFFTAAWLSWRFCDPASCLHILDHPNERSLHTRPIPRSGGVAILVGIVTGWGVVCVFRPMNDELGLVFIGTAMVAAVSFLDDRFNVSPALRFLVHCSAAALLLGGGLALYEINLPGMSWILPQIWAIFISLPFVIWMINLYNFMDGMDGFAGGMAVFGFTTFAILGLEAGAPLFAALNLIVAGAAAGFLLSNFPPARIFLGDTGSSSLGFLVAAFSLWASRDGLFPLWVAVLIFSPFIVDATVTLLRRLVNGEKVWRPHKRHYYQRLVQIGWGHRRTSLAEYLLMLSCSLSAFLAVHLPSAGQMVLIAAWLITYIVLMVGVGRLEKQREIMATQ